MAEPVVDTAVTPVVEAAVARARAALPAWTTRSARERAGILRRFRDLAFQRRHELAEVISRESGKTITDSFGIDVLLTLDFAAWTAEAAPRFLRSRTRGVSGLIFWRKRVRFDARPVGVIGVIAPWNYPFFMPASGVLPALACGNTVVLKPSEFTPESAALLGPLFREAGLPDGVLEIVQGGGRVGAALVRGGVDKVVFTGSAATGRKIAVACAEQLIPCSLELGGSDPAIVLADADVRHAADGTVWTRFANTGQTCVATKRVYVEAPVYEAYVAAASRAVTALRAGPRTSPDTEFGPLIHVDAARTIAKQRDDAVAKGARVAATASLPEGGGTAAHVAPVLLTEADETMLVLQEETFGPVLAVVRVRDADEAIRRANDSSYGLSASVWTSDRARGLAVARRLEAGTVMINDAASVVGMTDVPYGGVKESGIGRMHGEAGLGEFVRLTAVVDDRFTHWRQPWWYPYGAAHAEGIEAYAKLAHGGSLGERLRGLPGVVRLMLTRKGTA